MRIILFSWLLWLSFILTACQDQPTQQILPTGEEQGQSEPTSDRRQEVQANGDGFNLSAEDIRALTNGRFLLTSFMNQTENIPVPLADQWQLQTVEMGIENGRIFTFNSGAWVLILREPGPSKSNLLYQAQVRGPDNFNYLAEIHADGTIAPAQ